MLTSIVVITAGVTDGVTVGHPCCSVDHCQIRLLNVRDRFCPKHQDKVGECAVEGCTGQATQRHVTCTNPSHRAWEHKKRRVRRRGTAFNLLTSRLRKAGEGHYAPSINNMPSHVDNSPLSDPSKNRAIASEPRQVRRDISFDPNDFLDDSGDLELNVEKYKGRVCRRWTHNEQLFVSCCGIIKGRATFFGAEGPAGVIVGPSFCAVLH